MFLQNQRHFISSTFISLTSDVADQLKVDSEKFCASTILAFHSKLNLPAAAAVATLPLNNEGEL